MVLHNPNNWHWVDKNCISWARDYFKTELVGVKAEDSTAKAEISEVKCVEGDVEVCQRKGKVISLFDVAIEMKYQGSVGEESVSGSIKVPEVSYDNDEDDYQFQIAIDSDSSDKLPVKTLVRQKLVPELRKKLGAFGPKLIQTHGGGIQHSGNEPIHWSQSKVTSNSASAKDSAPSGSTSSEQKSSSTTSTGAQGQYFGVQAYNTTTVNVDSVFNASPEQVYATLIEPQQVAVWSRSAPNVEPKVGGTFSLFGGGVTGKFEELEVGKKIKQQWRLRDWKHGHYAVVTYTFKVGDGETTMNTHWEGVPVGQEEAVENNFQEYYIKPIKVTFGYGLL